MENWISVKDSLPEGNEWVIAQTQDGSIYPATYADRKWSPVFRGGLVEQLMHGKVLFWQPHAEGYPFVKCSCGRAYLQTPGVQSCPLCEAFKPKAKPVEKVEVKAEAKVEEANAEAPAVTEEAPKPKKTTTRKTTARKTTAK